ncbi:MAG: type II toxin-antitoxin system Phd/YefM family antitoxin [bacterium]|nr:type II toxin-antitoxin system Phd/YefM family antitoxin [bacterium]
MDPKKTLSITEARKRIFEIIDEVQKPDTYYTLTEKGRPKAVVLSYEEFDSLLETLELLSDPEELKEIEEAEREVKRGEVVSWDEVKKELGLATRYEDLVLREKSSKKYTAPRQKQSSSRKTKARKRK